MSLVVRGHSNVILHLFLLWLLPLVFFVTHLSCIFISAKDIPFSFGVKLYLNCSYRVVLVCVYCSIEEQIEFFHLVEWICYICFSMCITVNIQTHHIKTNKQLFVWKILKKKRYSFFSETTLIKFKSFFLTKGCELVVLRLNSVIHIVSLCVWSAL